MQVVVPLEDRTKLERQRKREAHKGNKEKAEIENGFRERGGHKTVWAKPA
jgi:hypothetical protein